eukprot:CAMPEP_0114550130 /NCGR_PEP_ID=MMETSP0114-20121206/5908_1 /TAXON_ID=31324 /ORGANISM="Goniomonas sp, Strain m" /LENGTH=475 /DNA_ID=CAMNT_0001734881 /DNA_START=62 /DNA_END=1490 /DNA_ORIENTATION=+
MTPSVFKGILQEPYAHQVFAVSVGFLMVFRASFSYNRLWEGRTALNMMTGKWTDSMNQMVTYDRVVTEGPAVNDSYRFIRSQVHLHSLLHAVALQFLREDEDLDKLVPESQTEDIDEFGHADTLVVLGGITPEEKQILSKVKGRPYHVLFWINRDIVQRHKAGGLAVGPPVLSRGMQALSDGFNAFEVASKIQDTLFPFPYAQLINMLVIMFGVSTPIAISTFTNSIYLAALLSVMAVVGIVALEAVAKEIECPYGSDDNDLPLSTYQEKFNIYGKHWKTLSSLRAGSTSTTPGHRDFSLGRRCAVRLPDRSACAAATSPPRAAGGGGGHSAAAANPHWAAGGIALGAADILQLPHIQRPKTTDITSSYRPLSHGLVCMAGGRSERTAPPGPRSDVVQSPRVSLPPRTKGQPLCALVVCQWLSYLPPRGCQPGGTGCHLTACARCLQGLGYLPPRGCQQGGTKSRYLDISSNVIF